MTATKKKLKVSGKNGVVPPELRADRFDSELINSMNASWNDNS